VGHGLEQALAAHPLGDIGGMHQRFDHQAQGIDQQMARAPLHLLAPVVARCVRRPPPFSGLDRLAVHDASAGRGGAARALAGALAQRRMDPFPVATQPPRAPVLIHRLPGRQVMREQMPGSAAP
jgi:hypothetical protein